MFGKSHSWFQGFLQRDYRTVGVGCRRSPSLLLWYDFTEFHCKCVISLFEFASNAPVIEADYLVHAASLLLICLTGVDCGRENPNLYSASADRPSLFPSLCFYLISKAAVSQQQHLWTKPSYLSTALMGSSLSIRLSGMLYVGQR